MNFSIHIHAVDRLPALTKQMARRLSAAVRKTAFAIERDAKLRAPVDTGALRSSIYVVTDQTDNSQSARAQAAMRRPGVTIFPPARVSVPFTANIGVAVEYGVYVEYGTHRAAAQPFLVPALSLNRRRFVKAVQDALRG